MVLSNSGRFWDVPFERSGGRGPRKLAEVVWPEGGSTETDALGAWEVLDKGMTESRMVMVLVSVGGTLLTIDEEECIDQVSRQIGGPDEDGPCRCCQGTPAEVL